VVDKISQDMPLRDAGEPDRGDAAGGGSVSRSRSRCRRGGTRSRRRRSTGRSAKTSVRRSVLVVEPAPSGSRRARRRLYALTASQPGGRAAESRRPAAGARRTGAAESCRPPWRSRPGDNMSFLTPWPTLRSRRGARRMSLDLTRDGPDRRALYLGRSAGEPHRRLGPPPRCWRASRRSKDPAGYYERAGHISYGGRMADERDHGDGGTGAGLAGAGEEVGSRAGSRQRQTANGARSGRGTAPNASPAGYFPSSVTSIALTRHSRPLTRRKAEACSDRLA